jgi:hypothetical protein
MADVAERNGGIVSGLISFGSIWKKQKSKVFAEEGDGR